VYLFEALGYVNKASSHALSFSCYFETEQTDMHYNKLLLTALSPFFVAMAAIAVWSVVYLIKHDRSVFRNQMIASIIVLLFLIHPEIVSSMFTHLSCDQLDDGNHYLLSDMAIECYEGRHNTYTFAVVIPSLIVWGFGIPAVVLVALIRKRNELKKYAVRGKYGFMYNGYKPEKFYWEWLIVYREISIIIVAVLMVSLGITFQLLCASLLMMIFSVLHVYYMPYSNPTLNRVEMLSIVTISISIYSGLFFLTNIDDDLRMLVAVLMISANGVFLFVWLYVYIQFSIKGTKLAKAIRKIFP
jgi:hypothetical protein